MSTEQELQALLHQFKNMLQSFTEIMKAIPEGLRDGINKFLQQMQELAAKQRQTDQQRGEQNLENPQAAQENIAEILNMQMQAWQSVQQINDQFNSEAMQSEINRTIEASVDNINIDPEAAEQFKNQCNEIITQTQQFVEKFNADAEQATMQEPAAQKPVMEPAAVEAPSAPPAEPGDYGNVYILDPVHVQHGKEEAELVKQARRALQGGATVHQIGLTTAAPRSAPWAGELAGEEDKLAQQQDVARERQQREEQEIKERDLKKGTFASPFTPPSTDDGPLPPGGG